jgi:hypothetical protein
VRRVAVFREPVCAAIELMNGARFVHDRLEELAARHPVYRERYQRTAKRLGRQRGKKIARVEIARKLAEAIWHMLTRDQPFAPAGATSALAAWRPPLEMRYRTRGLPSSLVIPQRTR